MRFAFMLCFLFISFLATGQRVGGIKGTVTDTAMNEEPVLFANVQLKSSAKATETNFHGNYEFNAIAPGKYTLVISYLGYETTEVPIVVNENKITEVNTGLAVLAPSFQELDLGEEEAITQSTINKGRVTAVFRKE